MLQTLYRIMLQTSETHLKILAGLYKIFRVSDNPGILCEKTFRDVLVRNQIKIKIVCYFSDFNRMVFKTFLWFLRLLLKSGVKVIIFASMSIRLFQRGGPREDIANLIALNIF